MNKTREAIRNKAITRLVSQGADVNEPWNLDDETALHHAVRNNDESLAKILLENGADPNKITLNGFTALHIAVRDEKKSLAKLLLENKADPNVITGTYGATALHFATNNNDESLAEILLKNRADPTIGMTEKMGYTAFYYNYAIRPAYEMLMKILLKNKADANINRNAALQFAVRNANESLAKILLENGADPNMIDTFGKTAFHYAIEDKNETLVKILFTQQLAFAEKQDFSLDAKLTNVVEIHVMNKTMEAIRDETIKRLVSQGANVNKVGKSGETALHFAVRHRKESLVKVLLENEANPNAINTSGDTPFHYAIKDKNKLLVKMLLENGADPNMMNTSGETALHFSARNANESFVKILLEKGPNRRSADPNANDTSGDTPLMQAAQSVQPKIMKLLLDAGAKKDKTNNINHKTALTYLQEKESEVEKLEGELHELEMNFSEEIEVYSQRGKIVNQYSKFFGVIYDQKILQWRAKRWIKSEKKFLHYNGYFIDEKEAAYASDELARKLMAFEKGHILNFPDENITNLQRPEKKGHPKYIGVFYDKNNKEWCAERQNNRGKPSMVSNGCYDNKETAARASDSLARLMQNYSARNCIELIPIKACIALIKNFSEN